MKDSLEKNRDVKNRLQLKATTGLSTSYNIRAADSLPLNLDTFWHPSEKVMDNLRCFLRHKSLSQSNDAFQKNLISSLGRYTKLPENHIQTFAGSDRAYESVVRTFVKPGHDILICGPVDRKIAGADRRSDVQKSFHYGITPFMTDPDGIIGKFTEKTKVIYLGNPNLCTGLVYSIDEIEYILDRASGAMLVLDETYYEYHGTSLAGLVSQYDNLIVIRSFSAAFGLKDLPCAYILTCPENIDNIRQSRSVEKPSAAALAAACAVLNDSEYIRKRINRVRENMTYLSVRLRSLGLSFCTTPADFLLLNVANPDQVLSRLKVKKIEIRSLRRIPHLQEYIALPVADDATSARIIDAFNKMPKQYYWRKRSRPIVTLRRHPELTAAGEHAEKINANEPEPIVQ